MAHLPFVMLCSGGVLLSHTLPSAVPSPCRALASRFGMETGRFPRAMAAANSSVIQPVLFPGGAGGSRGLGTGQGRVRDSYYRIVSRGA